MLAMLLADGLLLLHLLFILFVVCGGLLLLKWPRLVWLHLPAALWGAMVEACGWICPLTPWENSLRLIAGGQGIEADFIGHYLLPLVYPAGLTRSVQLMLAIVVVVVNTVIYVIVIRKRGVK